MARQSHTAVESPSVSGDALAAITFTAANVANKEQTDLTGRETVVCFNSGAGAHNITFTSIACDHGRTNDLTEAIAAGAYKISPRFTLMGWRQTDGKLYFEADHAEVKFAVIRTGN